MSAFDPAAHWPLPGMSDADIRAMWEAAGHVADAAPAVEPDGDVVIRLRGLFSDLPEYLRAVTAERARRADNPAA